MKEELLALKEKFQTIIGLVLIVGISYGLGKSIYTSYFDEPEFSITKSIRMGKPVENALFYYEEELEKISSPMVSAKLSSEGDNFTNALYDNLKSKGLVKERVKLMSDIAIQKMTELGAYATFGGKPEPTAWDIAQDGGFRYMFKIVIIGAQTAKRTNDLQSVRYQFTLYDVENKSILWQGETLRNSEFFGGMPDGEKTITTLNQYLKEANIIK